MSHQHYYPLFEYLIDGAGAIRGYSTECMILRALQMSGRAAGAYGAL
jgi:hypothetical protein